MDQSTPIQVKIKLTYQKQNFPTFSNLRLLFYYSIRGVG